MASSEVKICNEALLLLGQEAITSLTETGNPNATRCNLIYVPTRDEVLRAAMPNFAMARASLARISGETPDFGYDYFYQLPSDCLRVLGMDYSDNEYVIEGDKLLCDYTTAKILYIWRVTDPNLFDSIFVAALAIRIASKLAVPILRSRSAAKDLLEQYVIMIGLDQSICSQEGIAGIIEAEGWLEEHEAKNG